MSHATNIQSDRAPYQSFRERLSLVKPKPKRWVRIGLIALLLLGVGGFGIWRLLLVTAERSAPELLTQSVEQKTIPITLTANGSVEAKRSINLSPKTAGTIETLLVKEGDRVQQGQTIAVMDDAELRGQLTQAEGQLAQQEANLQRLLAGDRPQETLQFEARLRSTQAELQKAEADLNSYQQLYEAGAVSRQEYQQTVTARDVAQANVEDARQTLALSQSGTRQEEVAQARAQVQSAQGSLETIQNQLNETKVLAPFDGVVVRTYADVGSFVSPSMSGSSDSASSSSILELASDRLEIVVNIAESQIAKIQLGQTVQLEVDARPGEILTGTVAQIAPRATVSQNVTSFEVKVAVDEATSDRLAIGMNTEAEFEVSRLENALLVPNAAVVRQAEGTGVYILNSDSVPVFQPIETGFSTEGYTEVKSGLQGNEEVLLSLPESKPPSRGLSLPKPPQ